MNQKLLNIEIAYASEDKQHLISLKIKPGTSVKSIIEQSNIIKIANIQKEYHDLSVGIWSKPVTLDHVINENGNRIEIYRSLKCDPKEVRRSLS